MTTSHAQSEIVTPLPPGKRHLRLPAEVEVGHTEAGRLAVPLELCEGAAEPAPLPLVLTADEAVDLHSKLSALLAVSDGGAQ